MDPKKESMNQITREQKNQIQQILAAGQYKDKHHRNHTMTHIEHIYQAFLLYCQYRDIGLKCFKTRHFRQPPDKHINYRGCFYSDIPLSIYQVRLAIKHGIEKGDIQVVNNLAIGRKDQSRLIRIYRFNKTALGDAGK